MKTDTILVNLTSKIEQNSQQRVFWSYFKDRKISTQSEKNLFFSIPPDRSV